MARKPATIANPSGLGKTILTWGERRSNQRDRPNRFLDKDLCGSVPRSALGGQRGDTLFMPGGVLCTMDFVCRPAIVRYNTGHDQSTDRHSE